MRLILSMLAVLPSLAFSTDLIQFESGKAALARDVNENFHRLDTAIGNRAAKSGVESMEESLKATDAALKGVQATIGQIQTGKANQADVDAINTSLKGALTAGSLTGIRDSLKLKADSSALNAFKRQTETALAGKQATLGFTPLNAAGGTVSGDLSVSKSLTVAGGFSAGGIKTGGDVSALRGRFDTVIVPAGRMQLYPDGVHGAIYGDQAGDPGPGNYAFAWKRDGLASYQRAASKYLAIRSEEAAPTYGDGAAERTVWHSGNLDPNVFLKYGGNQGKGIFDAPNPPIGSWQYETNDGSDNSTTSPSTSPNIQVFSTGGSNRGFQIAVPYDADNFFMRRGQGAWTPWVEVVHSGNASRFALSPQGGTIQGDLRITGKLTTAPGATPADYVFEPDYKLSPLAEVEAFTKANKHLPEVPSASEMTENGVDLAKMNMVLLKKVEELTLHAIEQRKLLEAQRQELLAQKERLDRLESR